MGVGGWGLGVGGCTPHIIPSLSHVLLQVLHDTAAKGFEQQQLMAIMHQASSSSITLHHGT